MRVRVMTPADLPAVKAIVDAVALFPSAMLDAMTAPALRDGDPDEAWHVAERDGVTIGVTYHVPERMTEGAHNLLLIAVHPDAQGSGVGTALMRAAANRLAAAGARLLIVETSGLPDFAATRAFYAAIGYTEEARIRDFYQAGEDKFVFVKAL